MTDIIPPTTAFSVPEKTLLPKQSFPITPIALSLIIITLIVFGVYYLTPKQTAKIAVVDSVPQTTEQPVTESVIENAVDPIFNIIQSITDSVVWSQPAYGSLLDSSGNDVPGLLISTDDLDMNDASILPLLATDSPLISKYGWTQLESETGANEEFLVYQKADQKILIRYQSGGYSLLLAELL